MEYMITLHSDAHEFVNNVNTLIGKGWKISGGMSITGDCINGFKFCQALTRKIKINN